MGPEEQNILKTRSSKAITLNVTNDTNTHTYKAVYIKLPPVAGATVVIAVFQKVIISLKVIETANIVKARDAGKERVYVRV